MEAAVALGLFWLTHVVAVASPGPSFVVVSRAAVARSTREGVLIAVGLSLGTLLWAGAAWFGLAALFALVPPVYAAVRIAGALFLLWLAFRMWRHAREPLPTAGEAGGSAPGASPIMLGFWTQVANPKVAVFFGSIFAAVLPPDPSPALVAVIFAIVCLNEFLWYAGVALVLSRPAVRVRYARAKAAIDRAAAAILGALGLRLLWPE